jgi:tRNA(Ile)-lysidine synthase
LKRTLAGTVIERRGSRIAFYRESGRSDLPSVAVGPGYAGVWDGRFAVTVGEGAPAGLTLAALGESGRREVGATSRKLHDMPAPAGALAALPAIRQGQEIVAAPVFLDGGASIPATFRSILGKRLRTPPLFPDFTGD